MAGTPSLSRKKLALAALALAAVGAAVGGAVAASSGSSPAATTVSAFVDDAAGRLHVSPSTLQAALVAAESDRIDARVAAGSLTAQQAQRLKARLAKRPLEGLGTAAADGPTGTVAVAAAYLGLAPGKLAARLAQGETLAAIAQAQGKTLAGVTQAILDDARSRLEAQGLAANKVEKRLARLARKLAAKYGAPAAGGTTGTQGLQPANPGKGKGGGRKHQGTTGTQGVQPAHQGKGAHGGKKHQGSPGTLVPAGPTS